MRASLQSTRDRLIRAVETAADTAPPSGSALWTVTLTDPNEVQAALKEHLGDDTTVVLTGTLERRLLLIEHTGTWTTAGTS
ncbi:hypothetical protein [Nocardia sp. NRRL S-836]|uniref:hypothetical protein n=1 Tax=Nocardia sp. NRRL S-836 TaxID=1519492 RepID=UPI0006B0490B|nr:hypothetical protein [Nocardia sp. NRRL S-836]KOV84644.1 hypothetical protein ADL03_15235 [Nocardia sp. NRRL S-836]